MVQQLRSMPARVAHVGGRFAARAALARRCNSSSTASAAPSPLTLDTRECIPSVLQALVSCGALCSDVHGAPVAPASASASDLAAAVQRSAAQKCVVVYDLDALQSAFASAKAAFPSNFIHALAIKSAPMAFVIDEAIAAGCGIEAASFGEAASAVERGCPADRILFDSPAKTVPELRWALELGLTINADNTDELARIDRLLAERASPSASIIGLRVNPIVDGGEISIFAVSSPDSKFGHPLHTPEARAEVLEAFAKYPWLSALHAHVGSAGTSLTMLAQGASTLLRLADEVDSRLQRRRVTTLDIGGGLAATATFEEYAHVLASAAPGLFDGGRRVYTEFGRALTSKTGLVVTQVEYVKTPPAANELRIATCQAGADLMLRECYNPHLYSHPITAYDPHGAPLEGLRSPPATHNLAGPLCFAGDYIKKEIELPPLEPGDFVVVHDAGANSLSLWSRHCSRLVPPVYTFARDRAASGAREAKAACVSVRRQKAPEPLDRLLDFWR